jgi:hypothetical protein
MVVEYVRGTAGRDVMRARRLLDALYQVRETAASDVPLSVDTLSTWQAAVLGTPTVEFRRAVAYAKNGRERYGLSADTAQRLD